MTHWLCGAAFRLQELSVWARECVLFKGKALYPELDGPCQSVQASALWRSLIWLDKTEGLSLRSRDYKWWVEVSKRGSGGHWNRRQVEGGGWCLMHQHHRTDLQLVKANVQLLCDQSWATQDTILESEGCFIFYFLICKDIQCYTVVPLKSEQNYCLCKHCVAQILMCPVRFLEFVVSVCVYFWSFRITWAQLDLWPYLLLHRWMGSHLFELFS